MKAIRFDPKIFISPPYWECPNCNSARSFGVLMLCGDHYVRRCKQCWYDSSYSLPKLNKRIIYIDQFAISNMMKVLNPETKAYKKGALDKFWLILFERLDTLCKLQLIICPDSGFHTDESLLAPYFKPLKRMYELLSHGVTFYDPETIRRFQICEHAKNWISEKRQEGLDLSVHSIVHGRINAWQDRLIISTNLQYNVDWINNLRRARQKIHKEVSEVFKRWQSEKNRTFDDWFEEESMTFGRATLEVYLNHLRRFAEISAGRAIPTDDDIFPPSSVILVQSIHNVFRKVGIQDPDIWPKTLEYLTSSSLKDVPFIKVSSMLNAAIARKASAGQKKPPNQGMVNDIAVISVLLPYCDAMFIDKECHAYLREKPLSDAINYGTKVFSLNNKEKFLEYLNEIETKASREHLDKIDEVYGKTWRKPYTTLYKEKRE